MNADLEPLEVADALAVARELAKAGVPIFMAEPARDSEGAWAPDGGHGGCGYWLSRGWQHTEPDPAVLDKWMPGVAVCAVMGGPVAGIDVDPRNGGDVSRAGLAAAGLWPRSYGTAATPSGGTHDLVAALRVRSLDNYPPGVDVKAGLATGAERGCGFLFISPTLKLSKTTAELGRYRWTLRPSLPDPGDLEADDSGAAFAELVHQAHGGRSTSWDEPESYDGPAFADMDVWQQGRVQPWTDAAVRGICEELRAAADWPEGYRPKRSPEDPLGRGWERLCADAAWRLGRLAQARWSPLTVPQARAVSFDAAPTSATWTRDDVSEKWDSQHRRKARAPYPSSLLDDAPTVTVLEDGSTGRPTDQGDDGGVVDIDTDDALLAEMEKAAAFAREVSMEAYKLRVRQEAREKVAAEKAGALTLPTLTPLRDFLTVPDELVTHRVAGLWPTGGRVVLSAQHKAGKTTLAGNLLRSLADGRDFLDAFEVAPTGRVLLLDIELDERMLRRWLREQGILNTAGIDLMPMRGRLSTFDILDPETRTRWAKHLGPADVLVLACLRPALDALALSEDKDAGRFLEALDELTAEAGIGETLVIHHMGHNGERSRGDSRILDWPDAVWKLIKDAEDEAATQPRRYFAAYGRDVDHPETLLGYDPAARRLSVSGGSRRDRKVDDALAVVLNALETAGEPLSGRQVEERLRDAGPGRDTIRAALKKGIETGHVLTHAGPETPPCTYSTPRVRECAGSARRKNPRGQASARVRL